MYFKMLPYSLRATVVGASLQIALALSCTQAISQDAATTTRAIEESGNPKLIAANVAATQADWSRFRGPTGMGLSHTTQLPLTWSNDQNIAWKTPLPGPGASSPIVFGNRIYITYYTGYFVPGEEEGRPEELKRHLLALNRDDGSVVWDKSVPAKLPEEERIRDHGFAASTPAADEAHVYVFYGKTGVFAFDHAGEQVWQAEVGSSTNGWGSAASPVIHGDHLLINASVESESLIALDRRTGREVWRAGGIVEAWNTPLVVKANAGHEEIILPTQGKVQAFAPSSGAQLWTCATNIGWYMVPSVVAENGIIYCLGGRSGVASLAVRAGGRGDVTATHRLWTSQKGSNVSSPVFYEGKLYWVHDSRGVAFCAEAESGEVLYEQRLDRADQVYASALLAGERIYYLARDGRTFVVAAKPEFQQLAINDLRDGSIFNGSPAIDGKRLLIRSDKFLYCIE